MKKINYRKASDDYFKKEELLRMMEMYNSDAPGKKRMAEHYMIQNISKFILSLMFRYYRSYLDPGRAGSGHYEDMIQCGRLAVLEAMPNYDPSIGKPTTYFAPFILNSLSTYVTEFINSDTSHYVDASKRIKRYEDEYMKKHNGKTPSDAEILKATGIGMQTLNKIRRHKEQTNFVYLDDDENQEKPALYAQFDSPEKELVDKYNVELVHNALQKLDDTQKIVVKMKFGITPYERTYTHVEISETANIPQDKITKILSTAFSTIRRANSEFRKLAKANTQKLFDQTDIPIINEDYANINDDAFKTLEF